MEQTTSLKNPELLPTTDTGRTMSMADYIILWAGMTINIVGFSLGAQYYNGGDGLSPLVLAIVILVGYGLVTLLTVLVGDIGTTYGIPFVAYIRAPFGYKGATIASIFRAVPALYWFGFLTWVGAASLNYLVGIFIPGFDNLMVLIVLFGILQVLNAMFGLKAMAKFDWVAVPALGLLFIAILIAALSKDHISLFDILNISAKGNMSVAFAISGIAGGWITMSLNGSDLSRQIKRSPDYAKQSFFKRNNRAFTGQFIGMTIVGALIMLVGMIAGITSGEWDLNEVCRQFFRSKPGLALSFIAIVFAQWSTNTAANLMPPTYILISLFPRALKFWSASIIAGIIGIAIMPWKIQSSGTFLVDVQVFISTFLGPIIGIMLSDYFIIRKRKLNVRDLYVGNGQYTYTGGFNISALVALVAGFAMSFLNSNFGFFIALVTAPVVYVFLMKTFTLKAHDQKLGKVIELNPGDLA
jgi:NCS1 family nucleobase:cation symporter-1